MHFRKAGQPWTFGQNTLPWRRRKNSLIRHGLDPLYLFTTTREWFLYFTTKLVWSGFIHRR